MLNYLAISPPNIHQHPSGSNYCKCLWQYYLNNEWCFFEKNNCEILELAYQYRQSPAQISLAEIPYDVIIDQINIERSYMINNAYTISMPVCRISVDISKMSTKLYTGKQPTTPVWQYLDDKGIFRDYDSATNQILEGGFSNKKKNIFCHCNGQKYTMDLVRYVQINENTQKERTIQRTIGNKVSSNAFIWAWLDDDYIYKPYETYENNKIEEKIMTNKYKFTLTIKHKSYDIDLVKRTQYNFVTQKTRYMKRIPSSLLYDSVSGPAQIISNPTSAIWEWKSDNGFVSYDQTLINRIESAYNSGKHSTNIFINGQDLLKSLHETLQWSLCK